ncbi:MAG: TolC family protein [Planctomycetota bacterium]
MLRRRVSAVATAILLIHPGALLPGRAQAPAAPPARNELELTLDEAQRLALENNIGLQVDDLAAEAALYAARGSWGAFDWVLDANAGVTDDEFESSSVFGGSSTNTQTFGLGLSRLLSTGGTLRAGFDTANTDTDNSFSALSTATTDVVSLSYVQPLLRGAWRQYATVSQTIADIEWRRAMEGQRTVRQRLLLDVSITYWDLVGARAQAEVAESSLALARTQRDEDAKRLEAGQGTQIDVLSSETQVAEREQLLLAAQVTVRQRADALRKLILPSAEAEPWETDLIPSTPLPADTSAADAPAWTAALNTAMTHRPELRQQELLIQERKLQHDARTNETRPSLDLTLGADGKGFSGDSSEAFEEAVRYDFPTYQALLSFSFPLGNRSARGNERAAWAQLRAAHLVYDEIEMQIAGEVREMLRQVLYQSLAVSAAQKSLGLAQRQLEAEQTRYREGASTNFQVLSFQNDLTQALSLERNARANFAKALSGLAQAQGLIGEDVPR